MPFAAGSAPPQPGGSSCGGDVAGVEGEWAVVGKTGAQMALSCGAAGGAFSSVVFASFGTPTGSSCGSFAKGACDAANTSAWVASQCLGKSSCTLPADPTVRDTHSPLVEILGDPCPEVEKQLAVQLRGCNAPPSPSPSPALPVRLQGAGAGVVFDFGQEVGGFTTLHFGNTSDAAQTVSLAYSESSFYWIG